MSEPVRPRCPEPLINRDVFAAGNYQLLIYVTVIIAFILAVCLGKKWWVSPSSAELRQMMHRMERYEQMARNRQTETAALYDRLLFHVQDTFGDRVKGLEDTVAHTTHVSKQQKANQEKILRETETRLWTYFQKTHNNLDASIRSLELRATTNKAEIAALGSKLDLVPEQTEENVRSSIKKQIDDFRLKSEQTKHHQDTEIRVLKSRLDIILERTEESIQSAMKKQTAEFEATHEQVKQQHETEIAALISKIDLVPQQIEGDIQITIEKQTAESRVNLEQIKQQQEAEMLLLKSQLDLLLKQTEQSIHIAIEKQRAEFEATQKTTEEQMQQQQEVKITMLEPKLNAISNQIENTIQSAIEKQTAEFELKHEMMKQQQEAETFKAKTVHDVLQEQLVEEKRRKEEEIMDLKNEMLEMKSALEEQESDSSRIKTDVATLQDQQKLTQAKVDQVILESAHDQELEKIAFEMDAKINAIDSKIANVTSHLETKGCRCSDCKEAMNVFTEQLKTLESSLEKQSHKAASVEMSLKSSSDEQLTQFREEVVATCEKLVGASQKEHVRIIDQKLAQNDADIAASKQSNAESLSELSKSFDTIKSSLNERILGVEGDVGQIVRNIIGEAIFKHSEDTDQKLTGMKEEIMKACTDKISNGQKQTSQDIERHQANALKKLEQDWNEMLAPIQRQVTNERLESLILRQLLDSGFKDKVKNAVSQQFHHKFEELKKTLPFSQAQAQQWLDSLWDEADSRIAQMQYAEMYAIRQGLFKQLGIQTQT